MCNEQVNFDEFDDDNSCELESPETFVGKYFLLIDQHYDGRYLWPEGFAGVVKCSAGRNSYLIQRCKVGFKQHILPMEFFIESRVLIFDTFEELKEAKEKRYPREVVRTS